MALRFELSPLPYAYDALDPVLSAETLQFHHDKHHQAYIDKLNELLPGTEHADKTIEQLLSSTSGPLFNNAAQHWNHDFYWKCLQAPDKSPDQGPKGALHEAIRSAFGGLSDFKTQFEKMGATLFGSGWIWLTLGADKKLQITHGKDADTPKAHGLTPIFTCDVWEHAYYIDYRNARVKYLKEFWSIVNWEFVGKELTGATLT